jgi:C4-dicarboxylate-specific signal transduction histidine kinase
VMARNDFLFGSPDVRFIHERQFLKLAGEARGDLSRLADLEPVERRATEGTTATFDEYVTEMKGLVRLTAENDTLLAQMKSRADTLNVLTDQARERQHASNAEIARSLATGDVQLRGARDVMDAAYMARIAVADVERDVMTRDADPLSMGRAAPGAASDLRFDAGRLRSDLDALIGRLRSRGDARSKAAGDEGASLLARMSAFDPGSTPDADAVAALDNLAQWTERLLKIYAAQYRSGHDEAAQLLTYSVQAHDTELATVNIATDALRLGNTAADALARRDETAVRATLASSRGLADTMADLPISPMIQAEMVDAFRQWREGLQAAANAIKRQNDLMAEMDHASSDMVESARTLYEAFGSNAERTATSIQFILVVGAALGLLLGGSAALVVARSITQPLATLQSRITAMADGQDAGILDDAERRDELGDIARATNVFLREISRRERALRSAKERADGALKTLRATQAELIQAEKLASLGQLVAGVAHEINTPIGIALTASTVVEDEAERFRDAVAEGRISRSALDRAVGRITEGTSFVTANLNRAADLIQSFKHVAVDQTSGERRRFELKTFLHELLTSLGPMLRKAGHSAAMECPDGIMLDSHPGALGQVVTNLVVNASLHAFGDGEQGLIAVDVAEPGPDAIEITVHDHGCGIPPERRAKVFDPFFTTRRAQGSTGLGLHIVHNLVTGTLGGRIEIEAHDGCGTRFIIALPRAPQGQAKVPPTFEAVS